MKWVGLVLGLGVVRMRDRVTIWVRAMFGLSVRSRVGVIIRVKGESRGQSVPNPLQTQTQSNRIHSIGLGRFGSKPIELDIKLA